MDKNYKKRQLAMLKEVDANLTLIKDLENWQEKLKEKGLATPQKIGYYIYLWRRIRKAAKMANEILLPASEDGVSEEEQKLAMRRAMMIKLEANPHINPDYDGYDDIKEFDAIMTKALGEAMGKTILELTKTDFRKFKAITQRTEFTEEEIQKIKRINEKEEKATE